MFLFLLPLLSNFMIEKKKNTLPQWKIPHFSIKMYSFLNSYQFTSLSTGLTGAVPRRPSQDLNKEVERQVLGKQVCEPFHIKRTLAMSTTAQNQPTRKWKQIMLLIGSFVSSVPNKRPGWFGHTWRHRFKQPFWWPVGPDWEGAWCIYYFVSTNRDRSHTQRSVETWPKKMKLGLLVRTNVQLVEF